MAIGIYMCTYKHTSRHICTSMHFSTRHPCSLLEYTAQYAHTGCSAAQCDRDTYVSVQKLPLSSENILEVEKKLLHIEGIKVQETKKRYCERDKEGEKGEIPKCPCCVEYE